MTEEPITMLYILYIHIITDLFTRIKTKPFGSWWNDRICRIFINYCGSGMIVTCKSDYKNVQGTGSKTLERKYLIRWIKIKVFSLHNTSLACPWLYKYKNRSSYFINIIKNIMLSCTFDN